MTEFVQAWSTIQLRERVTPLKGTYSSTFSQRWVNFSIFLGFVWVEFCLGFFFFPSFLYPLYNLQKPSTLVSLSGSNPYELSPPASIPHEVAPKSTIDHTKQVLNYHTSSRLIFLSISEKQFSRFHIHLVVNYLAELLDGAETHIRAAEVMRI